MHSFKRLAVLSLIAALLGPVLASAAHGATLKVGDKAPELALGTWFKGEPVEKMKEGEIYIVECWATWCGPCIAAIPHVTELQKKYEDKHVTVIGVCVWDNADDEKVKAFVEKQGDKMGYRVTREHRDDPSARNGTMAETWLKAAGRNGIPCSFIVDKDGTIAWIGHPMRLETVLEQVVAGTFDAKKDAEIEAAVAEAQDAYGKAIRSKDWDGAMAALDKLDKLRPESAANYLPARLNILAMKGDVEGSKAIAEKAVKDASTQDDVRLLVGVASIMSRPGAAQDLDLAIKAGEKAVDLSNRKDGFVMHTLAKALAEKGEKDKAIALYDEAIKVSDGRLKQYLEGELAKIKG